MLPPSFCRSFSRLLITFQSKIPRNQREVEVLPGILGVYIS